MSRYILIPLFAFIALVQVTLVPLLPPSLARPDLMLVLVVAWGIVRGGGEAGLWGLGGGLFLDLLSGVPFGLQTVGLAATGFLADLMETNFFRSNVLLPLGAIFIATFLYHAVEAAVLQSFGHGVDWGVYIVGIVFPTAFLNTLLMPIAYGLLQRADRITRPRLTW